MNDVYMAVQPSERKRYHIVFRDENKRGTLHKSAYKTKEEINLYRMFKRQQKCRLNLPSVAKNYHVNEKWAETSPGICEVYYMN